MTGSWTINDEVSSGRPIVVGSGSSWLLSIRIFSTREKHPQRGMEDPPLVEYGFTLFKGERVLVVDQALGSCHHFESQRSH